MSFSVMSASPTYKNHLLSEEEGECESITACLSEELLHLLFSYLDFLTICKIRLTCRRWKRLSFDPSLIRQCFFKTMKGLAQVSLNEWIKKHEKTNVSHKKSRLDELPYFLRCLELDQKIRSKAFLPSVKTLCLQEGKNGPFTMRSIQLTDSKIYSVPVDNSIFVWDKESGRKLNEFQSLHSDCITCMQVKEDKIVTGSLDKTLNLWNVNSGNVFMTVEAHEQALSCLTIYENNIYSGSYDGSVKVWNIDTGDEIKELENTLDNISCLQVLEDTLWIGSYEGTICVFDIPSGKEIKKWQGHDKAVSCFLKVDKKIYSGSFEGEIFVWDISESVMACYKLQGHTECVVGLQMLNGKIISASSNLSIKVWDAESGEELNQFESSKLSGINSLTVMDEKIYVGHNDSVIEILDFNL